MPISANLKRIADLALVACDAAYAGNQYTAANGTALKEYRDPDTIRGGFDFAKPSTVVVPDGFLFLRSFEDTPSGLKIVAFENTTTEELVVEVVPRNWTGA